MHSTSPSPISGAPALASFTQGVRIQSDASVNGLTVGNPDVPAVDVTLEFSPDAISFSPLEPPVYIMGISVNATGFVDDSNEANSIRIDSGDGSFSGDYYPALGRGSGTTGSAGFDSMAAIADAINGSTSWNLQVTDGTTGHTRHFTVDVTSPGIPTDFVRPITLDTAPGATISSRPTFHFTQPPTSIPSAQNTDGFAFMIGNLPNNYPPGPGLQANDTSWAPDGPLPQDTYVVVIAKRNENPDQTLIQAATPVPDSGAPLASFSYHISIQSEADSSGLVVASRTCTADFNGDGDTGTDSDISAFFACLAGNCCATCASADFNGDGDTGTDSDIESFFRVLAGGPC